MHNKHTKKLAIIARIMQVRSQARHISRFKSTANEERSARTEGPQKGTTKRRVAIDEIKRQCSLEEQKSHGAGDGKGPEKYSEGRKKAEEWARERSSEDAE